jgi:hypothetical protein
MIVKKVDYEEAPYPIKVTSACLEHRVEFAEKPNDTGRMPEVTSCFAVAKLRQR